MPTIDDLRAAYATLKDSAPAEVSGLAYRHEPATAEITLLGSPHNTQHRRRILLPALVAATAVVAVTASVTLANSSSSSHHAQTASSGPTPVGPVAPNGPTPAPTSASPAISNDYPVLPATSSIFTVGPLPDGLHAVSGVTSPYMEQMTLDTSDGTLAGVITVAASLAWHPSIPADATKVKIGDQTGYYGTIDFDNSIGNEDSWFTANATFFSAGAADENGVLWQDQSGVWVYITGVSNANQFKTPTQLAVGPVPNGPASSGPPPTGASASGPTPQPSGNGEDPYGTATTRSPGVGLPTAPLSQAQAIAVANAIHIGTPQVAKVPIKLGYIPADFVADSTANLSDSAVAAMNQYHFIGGVTVSNPDADDPGFNTLYVGVSSGSIPSGVAVAYKSGGDVDGAKTTTITIAGYTGSYSPNSTVIVLRNGTVSLSIGISDGEGSGIPLPELTKLVQGITLASNLSDQSTWFNADKALS